MTLPILVVEELGLKREINIIDGVQSLLVSGKVFVGLIILAFSVVFPLGKIIGLFFLSTASRFLRHSRGRKVFWFIELVGRWGMLDVFLVAVLLAMMKADMVEINPGPGLLAFTLCVVLSLFSAACFDSESIWEEDYD
jgi:paraquat-inducible protein A